MASGLPEAARHAMDLEPWRTMAARLAPDLTPHLLRVGLFSPALHAAWSDLQGDDVLGFLHEIIGTAPSDPQALQWHELMEISESWAGRQASWTLRRLSDPALRKDSEGPIDLASPSEAFPSVPVPSFSVGRGGTRAGGWWPVGDGKKRKKQLGPMSRSKLGGSSSTAIYRRRRKSRPHRCRPSWRLSWSEGVD